MTGRPLTTSSTFDLDEVVALHRAVGWTSCADHPGTLQDVLFHPDEQRTGIGRQLVLAVPEPRARVRRKVLLTDDQPGRRAFYESSGYAEVHEHAVGPLRAFVRFDT